MADIYNTFDELEKNVSKTDYLIRFKNRGSKVLVLAPHGGKIEPGTSEITLAIAKNDLSYYLFEGKRNRDNRELHITSTNFDEPTALEIVTTCDHIIAIHGERNQHEEIVYIGGKNTTLREIMKKTLEQYDFTVQIHKSITLQGTSENNICNRCKHHGVQLEITKKLRDKLCDNVELMNHFVKAIRESIS